MRAILTAGILLCLAPLPAFAEELGDRQARQGHEYESSDRAHADFLAKAGDGTHAGAAIRIERNPSLALPVDAAGAASPVKPYYDFLYYTSVGNLDRALAEFADDAVVVAWPSCPVERPCRGKAAIKDRYIRPMIDRRISLPLPERYDGNRISARSDPPIGAISVRQSFQFRDGQIASVLTEGVADNVAGAAQHEPRQATETTANQ
jgi:hypothetical protein